MEHFLIESDNEFIKNYISFSLGVFLCGIYCKNDFIKKAKYPGEYFR